MRKNRIKYLIMNHLGIRLTTFCNLNCKNCADLLPYQKNCHYDYSKLVEDMDKILSVVDMIQEILLIGGEVFLYPHMNEVIEYCVSSPKIKNVVIVTNGTILPSEDTIKLLKNEKIIMRVSGYSEEVAPKRAELIQRIKQENIPLQDLQGMVWRNIGNAECRNRNERQMEIVWGRCSMNECIALSSKGRIYYCSRSMAADELECYPNPKPEEYVDVRNTETENLGEKLEQFYNVEYISTCNYCDGLVPEAPVVPTAAQIVSKSIIMQLLEYEVQLKEGTDEAEVISQWLNFVGEHYKQLLYEAGFENVLSYTLNLYKQMEQISLDMETKKKLAELWTDFHMNIMEAYCFNIQDITGKLQQTMQLCQSNLDKNTISVLVIENQQELTQDMQKADVILTLEDMEKKEYSIVKQALKKSSCA